MPQARLGNARHRIARQRKAGEVGEGPHWPDEVRQARLGLVGHARATYGMVRQATQVMAWWGELGVWQARTGRACRGKAGRGRQT